MKVYIFTEGGSNFGYGHLARCTSLYSELYRRSISVEFVVNGDKAVEDVLKGKKFNIRNWLSINDLSELLNTKTYSIVDTYYAEKEVLDYISANSINTVFIDDNATMVYPKGIIVNPSIYTKGLDYPESKDVKYLLGPKHVILRDAFRNANRSYLRTNVEKILITLGGSDISNLTPAILELLKAKHPNILKLVVIGSGFSNVEEIKTLSDDTIRLYFNATDEEMKSLMLESDLAITATGQTIYELIKTGTPFIPIRVAENQVRNAKGLLEYGVVSNVLNDRDEAFILRLSNEMNFMLSFSNRTMFNKKMSEIIDGHGSVRIIDELLSNKRIE